MSLLAVGAIAVSAIVIGSVAFPVVADKWNEGGKEAKKLVAATGAAVRKADDLGGSFDRVTPSRVEASGPGRIGPPDHMNTAQSAGPDQRNLRERNADREVAAALQVLAAFGAHHADFATDERIIAIKNLQEAWGPRYRQAEEDHRRLLYRIEHADHAAKKYFDTQTELTQRINNSENRLKAGRGDLQERELYRQWREQAGRTMTQADRIMMDLEDMDIRISKQLLSANFASVYRDFQQMPAAISALHHDLEQFHARSQEISIAFGEY